MKREIAANLSHRKNERGNVLAYTVISVLFLFLAVGLGADLSHLYMVRNELQNAADAAALAGASALLLPQDQRIPTSMQRTLDTLNKNNYNFNSQEFEEAMPRAEQGSLVSFAVNLNDDPYMSAEAAAGNSNIRFVKVVTPPVNVNIFFSIPILGFSRTMTATATAGLSRPNNVFCNFVPIAVVEGAFGGGLGWQDTNGDGVKDYATDCNIPDGAPAPGSEGACKPAEQFCAGCKYKMVAGPGAWEDTSPGNYQALDAGAGASDLKLAIAGGASTCLTTSDNAEFISETEPGRMTGPIQKGLNTRFDVYQAFGGGGSVTIGGVTKPVEEWFPPDVNIYENAPSNKNDPYPGIDHEVYDDADPGETTWEDPKHTGRTQRREITMPIIHFSEFQAGRDTVKFTKFGKFFLNRRVGGIPSSPEIWVEYMSPAMGAGGFAPGAGPAAPIVVPVLYR